MDPRKQLADILPRLNDVVATISDAEVDPPAGASPLVQLVAFTGRRV